MQTHSVTGRTVAVVAGLQVSSCDPCSSSPFALVTDRVKGAGVLTFFSFKGEARSGVGAPGRCDDDHCDWCLAFDADAMALWF